MQGLCPDSVVQSCAEEPLRERVRALDSSPVSATSPGTRQTPPLPEPLSYNKGVGLGALTSSHAHSHDPDLVAGVLFKIPDQVTAGLCLSVLLADCFGVMCRRLCWSKARGGRGH